MMLLCSCCTAASAVRRSTRSVWSLMSCRHLMRLTAGAVSCASTAVCAMARATYVISDYSVPISSHAGCRTASVARVFNYQLH